MKQSFGACQRGVYVNNSDGSHFRLHDYDNNTKLDGLEILKALTHLVPYEPDDKAHGDHGSSAEAKLKKQKEEELTYYMGKHYYTCAP